MCDDRCGSRLKGLAVFLAMVGTLFVIVGMATPAWYHTIMEVEGDDPIVFRGLFQLALYDGSGSTLAITYDDEDDDGRDFDPYCGSAQAASVFTSTVVDYLLRNTNPQASGPVTNPGNTDQATNGEQVFNAIISSADSCKTACVNRADCQFGVYTESTERCILSSTAAAANASPLCNTGCVAFVRGIGASTVLPSQVLSQDTVNFAPIRDNDVNDWCDKKKATQGLGIVCAILGVLATLVSICMAQGRNSATIAFIVLMTLAALLGLCASAVFGSWADDQTDVPRAYERLLNLEDSDRGVSASFALFTVGWILYVFCALFAGCSACFTDRDSYYTYDSKLRHGTVI